MYVYAPLGRLNFNSANVEGTFYSKKDRKQEMNTTRRKESWRVM